jgi:p-cymene monooxygenase electron transfer component
MVDLAEEKLLKAGVPRHAISADRFLDRSSAR